jgi:hypothetical protein
LDDFDFSGVVALGLCLALFFFDEQLLVSLSQELSPLKMNICVTIIPTPTAVLYHAMERNWLMGNCAKITATPIQPNMKTEYLWYEDFCSWQLDHEW